MPRCLRGDMGVGFFDEKGRGKEDDAGSVRRYRVGLRDDDEDVKGEGEESGCDDERAGDEGLGAEKLEAEKAGARPKLASKRTLSGWHRWGIPKVDKPGVEGG